MTSPFQNTFDLDEKIKKNFRLFTGVRPQEEDKRIYEKVYDLCFDEMIKFLYENLSKEDQNELTKNLESQKDLDKKAEVLSKALLKIEDSGFRLEKRIDYFLNSLLYQTLKQK